MPSAETVEIDAVNNDVAILDASDCALAAASSSSSLVSASLLSSSSIFDGFATLKESSNTVTQYSQESDMAAVAKSGEAGKESGDNDDDDNEMAEEKKSPGSGRQVSPMPQKKGATIVTPRSIRKAPPSKSSSSTSSSGCGQRKTSSSRKPKKGAAEAVAVAVDTNVNCVDSTTPTSPSSPTSSITHPSTAFPSGAAIATPGEEDSAVKKKKKNEVASMLPKKPTTTLHSFFRKADPSAKKKTVEMTNKADVKKVEVLNVGEEPVTTLGVVVGGGSSSSSSTVNGDKVEKIDEDSTSNHEIEVAAVVEKSVTSPKETAAGIQRASKHEKQAPGKKKRGMPQPQGGKEVTSKAKSNDVSAVMDRASSLSSSSTSSLSTSGRKHAEKTHNDNEEDLDDSPAFALAAALRMVNNGRRGKSRHIGSGGAHPEVVVRNENKTTNKMVALTPTDETAADALQHDKSSSFPDTVVEVLDPVKIGSNDIDIDGLENIMQDTPFAGTSSTVAIDEHAIAPTCELKKIFEIEEYPAENIDTNGLNKEEATLSETFEVSHDASTEMAHERQTTCDSMNKVGDETTRDGDAEIVAGTEIDDDMESDDSIKETTVDEVKVVDEVKEVPAISFEDKPTSAKILSKPRKKKNCMPSNKSSNTKTVSVTKAQSSINTSLKKLATCTPKMSILSPAKTQISPSTATKLPSGAMRNTASFGDNVNLSPEDASRLHHYLSLRAKYAGRASELGNLPSSDTFEEENLCLEGTLDKGSVEIGEDGGFPDMLLTHLQVMTQGR
jgi:hypothetical protein